jgi:hypothetical protein
MSSKIQQKVDEFEEKLGLPSGFYTQLLNEGDWSFVIKISALIEAACTHILSYKFRHPELEDSFSYLEQGNRKVGRVALLKKCGALFENQAKVLFSLAELRNSLAHNIKNTNFNFDEYIKKLDKHQKIKFINEFGNGLKDEIVIDEITVKKATFVLENPRLSIWLTCHEIIACLYIEIEKTDIAAKLGSFSGLENLTNRISGSPKSDAHS